MPAPDRAPTLRTVTPRPLVAVVAFFVANGLVVGAFGGSLPGLQDLLDLDSGQIVAVLVVAGLSAIIGMNVSGPLSDRIGVRLPLLASGVVLALGAVLLGQSRSTWMLLVAAAVFGLGNGAMDVAMNALGVWVEKRRDRPVMSRLHAGFSLGNFTGALLVVLLGRVLVGHLQVRVPLTVTAGAVAVLLASVAAMLPATSEDHGEQPPRGGIRGVPTLAWLLAAMALCFGVTEGTGIDWSSLHVRHVGGVSASTAAWGLVCVSGFMVVVRLVGDLIVQRLGRANVIRAGSAVALVGYVITAFTSALPSILTGWCLVGLGVGLIAPQVYAMAGHLSGGRGLALVVSFGYTAFLLGPGLIGFVARHSDLQRAMLVPVVTALGLIAMSWRLHDPADAAEGAVEAPRLG